MVGAGADTELVGAGGSASITATEEEVGDTVEEASSEAAILDARTCTSMELVALAELDVPVEPTTSTTKVPVSEAVSDTELEAADKVLVDPLLAETESAEVVIASAAARDSVDAIAEADAVPVFVTVFVTVMITVVVTVAFASSSVSLAFTTGSVGTKTSVTFVLLGSLLAPRSALAVWAGAPPSVELPKLSPIPSSWPYSHMGLTALVSLLNENV